MDGSERTFREAGIIKQWQKGRIDNPLHWKPFNHFHSVSIENCDKTVVVK